MTEKMGLCVNLITGSVQGLKSDNEDYVGHYIPQDTSQLLNKGIAVAVADGVSSAEAGKEASITAVTRFVEDYYKTPDTWSVSHAGSNVLSTINLNLFKRSHEFTNEEKGFLCTFSGMIIKSQTGHFFHAGDSRIYLLREGTLKQLTRDHIASIGNGRSFLARAMGMDNSIQIDYGKVALQPGDRLLFSSDGIHDFIEELELTELLSVNAVEDSLADLLISQALANGSDDNLSCAVVEVLSLPKQSLDEYNAELTRLPFPPPLEPGMKLDGYLVKKEIFASSRSQLYLVQDIQSGKTLVMKTPSVNFVDDTGYIDRFIQEEWIGKRIESPKVVHIVRQKNPRTFLYYLMEYVEGISMDKWMAQNPAPKPKVAIDIIEQIAQGLGAFHQKETIHQDLKPANILIDDSGEQIKVIIVDFGSVFVAGLAEIFIPLEHQGALGTATYSDPQYLTGKNSNIQGDLYSLATICYELFTGHLPYTEKINECTTAFQFDRLRYIPAAEHNPVIPVWFDRTLERAVIFDLDKRYSNFDTFLRDLKNPNPEYLKNDPKTEKHKSPVLFWQMLCAFWFVVLLMVVVLF